MWRLVGKKVVLIGGLLLIAGCGHQKGEEEVRNFVGNYCSVLQEAYAKADLKAIRQMATDNEMKKLFPVIQALTVTENSMPTEVLDFKIEKVKLAEDKATVRTSERWSFWWVDRKTQTITKPKVVESYKLRYNLVKNKGRWMVDSVESLDK
jgi:hypothetical protein